MKRRFSNQVLKNLFNEIVDWMRSKGCKIYCHYAKKTVSGSNGYFTPDPEPHIRVGLKGRPIKRALILIIHEFCHYWQWKTGFLGRKDDEGNIIYSKILKGEEVTDKEREIARRLVAISEYDCEKRTAYLIKKWKLDEIIPIKELISSSNTYNRHTAWSIGTARKPGSGVFYAKYDNLAKDLWGNEEPKWFSLQQVVAPISETQAKVFDKAAKKSKKQKH